jgi:hypothetical protein
VCALRACAVLTVALCSSCTGVPRTGTGSHPAAPGKPFGQSGCGPPITYQVFQQGASGVNWSKANDLIAFNTKASDGLFHIYTVKPDGMNRQQLGAGSASFPQRTTGTPAWSPTGRFMAFVAEKSTHPGNSVGATPGWGSYSDLWVATADGSRAWQLTDVPVDKDHGTIIPEFSPDGRLLEWTERTAAGKVLYPDRFAGFGVIKVADFNVAQDGTPSLSNIRTISPEGDAFNETGGFSADSTSVVFTSDFETHNFLEKPDLPPRPQLRCNHTTDPRRQLQRAPPLHPGRPGPLDDQCRQPVTRNRLVDHELRRFKSKAPQRLQQQRRRQRLWE